MTNEEIAVQKFLSKPYPMSVACGCSGVRNIEPETFVGEYDQVFELKIEPVDAEYRLKVAMVLKKKALHLFGNLNHIMEALDGYSLKSSYEYEFIALHTALEQAGARATLTKLSGPKQYPDCSCAMRWIEEVDNCFYQIVQTNTKTGCIFTAEMIGPVGGPYKETK